MSFHSLLLSLLFCVPFIGCSDVLDECEQEGESCVGSIRTRCFYRAANRGVPAHFQEHQEDCTSIEGAACVVTQVDGDSRALCHYSDLECGDATTLCVGDMRASCEFGVVTPWIDCEKSGDQCATSMETGEAECSVSPDACISGDEQCASDVDSTRWLCVEGLWQASYCLEDQRCVLEDGVADCVWKDGFP